MNVPFFDIKKQYSVLNNDILESLKKIFESCSFVGGESVTSFERKFSEYIGAKYAVSCGNGTDALYLALRACGVDEGDEVITTSFSFFATAEAIALVGAVPIFVDVREEDYLIDVSKIEEVITEKTKAILPVQLFGACCDMDNIIKIAKKHNLKVIEDDAQAIGSKYKGRMAGTLADVGCFSFYPTKNLGGCGDGGMCVTNSFETYQILLGLKEHGSSKNGYNASKILGYENEEDTSEEVKDGYYDPMKYFNYLIGCNSRLDSIQAEVLSIKLKHLDMYNKRREEISNRYFKELKGNFKFPEYSEDNIPCWHQFVLRTENKFELSKYLSDNGVGNGTFYPVPLHKQKAFSVYKRTKDLEAKSLPVSEMISQQTICLPCYPELTDEEIRYVIETFNKFFEEN